MWKKKSCTVLYTTIKNSVGFYLKKNYCMWKGCISQIRMTDGLIYVCVYI